MAFTLGGAGPLSPLPDVPDPPDPGGECSFGFKLGVIPTLALQTPCQEELPICPQGLGVTLVGGEALGHVSHSAGVHCAEVGDIQNRKKVRSLEKPRGRWELLTKRSPSTESLQMSITQKGEEKGEKKKEDKRV